MNIKLDGDKKRLGEGKFHWIRLPQYRFVYYKRKCEQWNNKYDIRFYIYRLIYKNYQIKYNTEIPSNTNIGKGLYIGHLGGIVINSKAIIGNNVNILNGVLIGQQSRGNKKGNPTIGNCVWIGTNSIIVGKVYIGNNVLIAPSAYVNFDVPDNSIVIGNPGRVISSKCATANYIDNLAN